VSDNFLEPGECHVEYPDSECGAFIEGQVKYTPPNYVCKICFHLLKTETDIEADNDEDFQPGEKGETDGEAEDSEATSDNTPINALDVQDTPEEKMKRDTQQKLREIIQELNDGEGNTDVYTTLFINKFDEIVQFYMLFTKHGPFKMIDRPSEKKEVVLEAACAYMMVEKISVRFTLLAQVTGYKEQGLISAALRFIETYKGDEYQEGAFLIEIYTPAVGLPETFIKPMQEVWLDIAHPRGTIRDRVVAFIGAYAKISEVSLTQVTLSERTGATRATLSPKIKQYEKLIKEYLKV
jgi:DNA-binding protein Fis